MECGRNGVEHWKYITTIAVPSAPVAHDESSYPVLIFLEGLNGLRQMNTFQVEELVSHGYVVAAIDQPYATARSGPSGWTPGRWTVERSS